VRKKADATKAKETSTGYRRARAPEWLIRGGAMALGIALFILVWAVIAKQGGRIPGPGVVLDAALKIFADPFYINGWASASAWRRWWASRSAS
jgi:hypothetical protein